MFGKKDIQDAMLEFYQPVDNFHQPLSPEYFPLYGWEWANREDLNGLHLYNRRLGLSVLAYYRLNGVWCELYDLDEKKMLDENFLNLTD